MIRHQCLLIVNIGLSCLWIGPNTKPDVSTYVGDISTTLMKSYQEVAMWDLRVSRHFGKSWVSIPFGGLTRGELGMSPLPCGFRRHVVDVIGFWLTDLQK